MRVDTRGNERLTDLLARATEFLRREAQLTVGLWRRENAA